MQRNPINPIFKIKFSDLYHRDGLLLINQYFLDFLNDFDNQLYGQYISAKNNPKSLTYLEKSQLLIGVAKVLEDFLVLFFDIKIFNQNLIKQHKDLKNLYIAKRIFVQRRVAKNIKQSLVSEPLGLQNLSNDYLDLNGFELKIANEIAKYLQNESEYREELLEMEKYCSWALYHKDGILKHRSGVLFKLPKKTDFENLLDLEISPDGTKKSASHNLSNREGFKLTDKGCNLSEALDQASYCIYCHNQGKDSCSIGLKSINKEENRQFQVDQFQNELSGCPLGQKISEMNLLKSEGNSIGSLAIAIIDNPMIAGTGHRICNDCMKSCIYQKQEPVNIPQIETRILKDVLELPFGFEIYSLLTRWNPLNLERILEKKPSGYKVLVAGLGPAGYTLAHHLLNEGHLVVGVDGLKIEPLDPEISGINLQGERVQFKPIENIKEIYEELDKRTIGGFGGVAEYGITVRWDKNFLKIIRLLLERREHFRMFGGFRLGSGLDCFDALKEYDFDHIALCLGAGWAKIPEIKNNFLKGIRVASDFLMSLQLTGAQREDLFSNLQVRLPILVVGSGLTAFDTACEALAYYPKQVENFAKKYQLLCQKLGKSEVEKGWNEEEKIISEEFLEHFSLIESAKKNGENITLLLKKLGGAKIIYRKKLQDSPAYKLNHEEVQKAFEEGIEFVEDATPIEAISDQFGQIKSLKVIKQNQDLEISCNALFLAAGATPNKAPFYEDKLKFELDGGTFQIINLLGEKLVAINSPKGKGIGFICAKNDQGKTVSFFGDLHPSFNGSVVKAMASAKNGYPIINDALSSLEKAMEPEISYQNFLQKINFDFAVRVKEVNVLSEYFVELVVHCPLLSRKAKLGHIFRLQNYHSLAKKSEYDNSVLVMEGVAVTTYKIDPKQGTITVMVVNDGGSSSMVKNLSVGEPLIFMGPTGVATNIFHNQNVVLIAGGRGIFPLSSLAFEYKKNNCQVTLFCGFKKAKDLIRQEELENCCDRLILSFEDSPQKNKFIKLKRPDDLVFYNSDVVQSVIGSFKKEQNQSNKTGEKPNKKLEEKPEENIFKKIDLVLTMGSAEMMDKIAQIYHQDLKEHLSDCAIGITNLSSPMQCMLKGVCSQCLQRKIDSKTGKERFFYACLGQDQKLSEIDFNFLKNRCGQNSLTEKLTKIWLYQSHL